MRHANLNKVIKSSMSPVFRQLRFLQISKCVRLKKSPKESILLKTLKSNNHIYLITISLGLTFGAVIYILKQKFENSPSGLYHMASDKCIKHQKIQDSLGNPIKVFGEENGKLKHLAYEDEDGLSGLRFQFHLQGSQQRGLAEVDAREDPSHGKLVIKYIIFTSLFDRNTIIVEDNRSFEESSYEESNIENLEPHSHKDDEAIIWIEKTDDELISKR